MTSDVQTILCMKWGDRYGAAYVNKLNAMIQRHTERATRLVCFTDDPSGVVEDVIVEPLPEINLPERVATTPWRKLSLWRADLSAGGAQLSGDVLFMDLDMVITGPIDDFFDFEPGDYCVIENWTQPGQGVGNTSMFRFPIGAYNTIFDDFHHDPEAILAEFRIEQQYISDRVADQKFWPAPWCLSFKHSLIPAWPQNFFKVPELPPDARAIAFTGKPDIDEAAEGRWPVSAFYKKLYKHVRPTPWLLEHWR